MAVLTGHYSNFSELPKAETLPELMHDLSYTDLLERILALLGKPLA
jgi:hypothetical protein